MKRVLGAREGKSFPLYIFGTPLHPDKTMHRLLADTHQVRWAAQAVGGVGLLYALTSVALAAVGSVPLAPAFLLLLPENYYFWQAIFIIPYTILVWILVGGWLRLLGKAGKAGRTFEQSMALAGSVVAPVLFVAWVPSGVSALFMILGMEQGELVEILSSPGIWQTIYIAVYILAAGLAVLLLIKASGRSQKLGRAKAVVIGTAAAFIFIGTFLMFVR